MFTAHSLRSFKALSTQGIPSFSFTVDPVKSHGTGTPVSENHPKLRFIWFVSQDASISVKSIIRWVADTVGLVEKTLCELCVSSEAGGVGNFSLWN